MEINSLVFDKVIVLSERVDNPGLDVTWVISEERQTFRHLINLSRKHTELDDIVVLSNADIFFVADSVNKIKEHLQKDQAFCLTRHELTLPFCMEVWDVSYSQDVWVFREPIKPDIQGDYFIGVPGCDNRFTYELQKVGYQVSNPSKSIRTYHLHGSAKRSATNNKHHRVPPPYLYIYPHHLGDVPRTYLIKSVQEYRIALAKRRWKS